MRIAIIRQKYTPFGGAERFVSNAIHSLTQSSDHLVDITLISRQWKDHLLERQPFHFIQANPFYFPRTSLFREKSFCKKVQEIVKENRFDITQTHERIPGCDIFRAGDGVHATWLAQRARISTPIQQVGFRINAFHRYQIKTEIELFSHTDLKYVICNSEMVKKDIMTRFGLPPEKLPVIYNGYDPDKFSPQLACLYREKIRKEFSIPQQAPVFLFVGSGFERKGLKQAIDAVATQKEAYLLIVGHDKKMSRYQSHAKTLLGHRALFIGSSTDVRPYYGASDALILPTLYDPFPNVIFEAMGSGLPVITTNACGGMDMITDHQEGFICDCLDNAAFATAIDCLSDLPYAKRLGENALDRVKDLTFNKMSSKLTQLYQMILNIQAP